MPGWTGSLLVRARAAVLPALSSPGVRMRADCAGSLLSFLRAATAALRRCSSGSFGQFGAFAAAAAAGGGRSSLGGTTSGERSRYSMPRFSMLVPPRPGMMPSMIFSSKVLSSSSSSSAARTGPDGHHETDAKGNRRRTAAPGSARYSAASRSGFGLAHRAVPIHNFRNMRRPALRGAIPLAGKDRRGPYRPGSGRFCGGYPQEGIIQ